MYRIRGVVKQVSFKKPIYGVIVGDDGRDYFFISSLMQNSQAYWTLAANDGVEFDPERTPTGWRARDISVLSSTERPNGEESRLQQPS